MIVMWRLGTNRINHSNDGFSDFKIVDFLNLLLQQDHNNSYSISLSLSVYIRSREPFALKEHFNPLSIKTLGAAKLFPQFSNRD